MIEEEKTTLTLKTKETEKEWHSCCFSCDKTVVLYMTKTAFSAIILSFAMYIVLSNDDPCKDLAFPTGLIGAILGSFAEQGHQRMTKE